MSRVASRVPPHPPKQSQCSKRTGKALASCRAACPPLPLIRTRVNREASVPRPISRPIPRPIAFIQLPQITKPRSLGGGSPWESSTGASPTSPPPPPPSPFNSSRRHQPSLHIHIQGTATSCAIQSSLIIAARRTQSAHQPRLSPCLHSPSCQAPHGPLPRPRRKTEE